MQALRTHRWMVLLPLLLAAVVSLGVLVFSEFSHNRLYEAGAYARRSLNLQDLTRETQALVLDAETSQRGYLLPGREEYLEPYKLALQKLNDRLQQLATLVPSSSAEQLQRVEHIDQLIRQRMGEIEMGLAIYRQQGPDAAYVL